MKEWTLVGIPPVVYGVTALGKAETARNEKRGIKIEPPSEGGLLEFPENRYSSYSFCLLLFFLCILYSY